MGLFDSLSEGLKGALGQVVADEAPALINAALAKTNMGDLSGIVGQLQASGLGPQVASWLNGSQPNIQITPAQVQAALTSDQLKQIAQHFGVDTDAAANLLAQHLPAAVAAAPANDDDTPPEPN